MTAVLVLFDLDGTLTDPYEGITKSVSYAVARMGLPALDDRVLRSFIGPPLQDALATALSLDAVGVQRAVSLYRERFAEVGLYENRVYDGMAEVLSVLASDSIRMAVATSKPTPFAQRILSHFGLATHFELVAGATLDGARRRKADVIAFALDTLGVDAANAVMVGDRAQDVVGARAHGVRSIGVRWGYAEPDELETAGADTIVGSPSELLAAVRR